MNGRLIAMEGLDGSGKATQTGLLCKALSEQGVKPRRVSFPDYDEPSSALVKMYLNGEFGTNPDDVNAYAASSFYAVDRFASYQRFWKQDYQNGAFIVADRYTTSNIVFQLSKLPKEQWDSFIDWLEDYEYGKLGLPRPDLTIYLSMPLEVSQKLLTGRYHGNESKKDIHESNGAYLAACHESAVYAAQRLNWKIIRCAQGENPKAVEEIHEEVMQRVTEAMR
ncbi:dTMP kinase [Caproiciproducens galactitolivorans]|uniref:Thymidylate kinase n=1 Tax=Caproiciproducens galactitolivorans TaxID=642589 RepID=A0ABT4BVN9_9FIRM|nr:deoxynucleoside kinase [Caproiciproducens galactitolivorans]MCY1713998.1 deoxynucleoside kinase [Caproiciproducens galactitolivorans]